MVTMKDILNLRQENSKTYNLGGNKRQLVVSIGAIHYKDDYANEKEQWKDIDPTWEGNKITKAPYELTRDNNKFTFKDKRTGEISTIERVSVFPPGIGLEIIPELSAVRFRHTLPSVNIPFEAQFKVTGKAPATKAFDDEGELELEATLVDEVLTEKLSQVKDKQTGKIRPAKGNIRIDPTWQVAALVDDCYRRLAGEGWDPNNSNQYAGCQSGLYPQVGGGMRFLNITIPQGSTIDTAKFTLRCTAAYTGEVVNTRISAEDADDTVNFNITSAQFDARWANRTSNRVDWDAIPVWSIGTDYDSPEIKTVIKEIVDRVGWASGNSLVIFWDDFDNRSTQATNVLRRGYAYDGSTTYAPKLTIAYSAGGTAALTGTAVPTITEADVVAGGKTTIITLVGDTWVASGATFDAQRQNIINGIDSAQSEATGWDAIVKAGMAVTDVVRTSNTVVTITLEAFATYNITANETITVTIPATALVGNTAIVASPTFAVTFLGVIYPSDPITRVMGLVHRCSPGNYTLEIFLGDIRTDWAAMRPQISRTPDATLPAPPMPVPPMTYPFNPSNPWESWSDQYNLPSWDTTTPSPVEDTGFGLTDYAKDILKRRQAEADVLKMAQGKLLTPLAKEVLTSNPAKVNLIRQIQMLDKTLTGSFLTPYAKDILSKRITELRKQLSG